MPSKPPVSLIEEEDAYGLEETSVTGGGTGAGGGVGALRALA